MRNFVFRKGISRNSIAMLLCLLISVAVWFYIKLTKNYNADDYYNITFSNKPKDMILVNDSLPSLYVSYSARGFDIIKQRSLGSRKSVEVGFDHAKTFTKGNYSYYYILTKDLQTSIEQQFSFNCKVHNVQPDSLIFKFISEKSRELPVNLNLHYTINSQYDQVGEVEFSPTTVNVYSTREILDTLTQINTLPLVIQNIDSNINVSVPLLKTVNNNLIKYSEDSVRIDIKVVQVTEDDIKIRITPEDKSQKIEFFPYEVSVIYRVPLDMYKMVDKSQFVITATIMPDSARKIKLNVEKKPDFVKIVRIEPTNIEYLKIVE
ncbi:MAG: YbbR-like domain-containing protein [Bacteroidales bacterium]